MYSSMCFMSVVALLVMDVRTGALQERDIQTSRCYSCINNGTTSCEQADGWDSVTCADDTPLCATAAAAPDFHSSLICAPATKKPCSVQTSDNASFGITCVCNTPLCNIPFSSELQNELLNLTTNKTNIYELHISELLAKYMNSTEKIDTHEIILTEGTEVVTTIARSSSQPISSKSVPATLNMDAILRDSERPRAEALKQQPTVPSDDDDDESEGSGSEEEPRVHNHAVSAPAAPSSFLPADENSATSLYKKIFFTTLFIFLVL